MVAGTDGGAGAVESLSKLTPSCHSAALAVTNVKRDGISSCKILANSANIAA